jgi:hypothetical protein
MMTGAETDRTLWTCMGSDPGRLAGTVKSQTRASYRKLGATTRDEAVVRARQFGLA